MNMATNNRRCISEKTLKKVAEYISREQLSLGIELGLSSDLIHRIQDANKSADATFYILKHWRDSSSGSYEEQIEILRMALMDVKRNDIIKVLDHHLAKEPEIGLASEMRALNIHSGEDSELLTKEDKDMIQIAYADLHENMRPDSVVPKMYSAMVLTQDDFDRINSKALASEKTMYVLDLVRKGTYMRLKALRRALCETDQKALADLLPHA